MKINENESTNDLSKIEVSLNQIANCFGYFVAHMDNTIPKNDEYSKIDSDPVIVLHSLGFSKEQIACIVDISINATKLRLSRGGKTKRTPAKTEE